MKQVLGTGPSLARLGAGAPNHDRPGAEGGLTWCGYSLAYRPNMLGRQELRVRGRGERAEHTGIWYGRRHAGRWLASPGRQDLYRVAQARSGRHLVTPAFWGPDLADQARGILPGGPTCRG